MFSPLTECTIWLSNMMPPTLIIENTVCFGSNTFRNIIKDIILISCSRGDELTEYLNRVDNIASARMDFLVSQMQK